MTFQHQHAAHCESGTIANLLRHHGAQVSEPLAFGASAALGFAYLPFIRLNGLPLIAYRAQPRAIIKGTAAAFGTRFRFERFSRPAEGQRRLDELLAQGQVVGLQTSVFWLPYFPETMRFHFNAHNLLVYGKEGDDYLISDPVAEDPQRCAAADLARARFARGVLAPRGLLYYPAHAPRAEIDPTRLAPAIRKTARNLLAPLPLIGVRGMRTLAARIARLDPRDARSSPFIGHLVRMQEEIGTGGAGFRFLYAAFLQEADARLPGQGLAGFAAELMEIGDAWRDFALAAARMVKGRDALDPPAIAALLRAQAAREETFFRALLRAV
ncbi:MAG: BtrH N-terminal domain-containing protein [Candidatus Dactylopiibacterium sp.]|nr:BtrH N-terminal domain-containing protein [Candidatus Dactylopiibacterium sp.]